LSAPSFSGGSKTPLGGGQRDLGVPRVDVERVDRAEHAEEIGLVHHERHLRIGLEQVHAASL